ncbi:MAG TPA: hypothetical protein VNT04_05045 [Gaiellaceae bacterium]|nr:hypothetical protein [Gaiellaceae bacterium]
MKNVKRKVVVGAAAGLAVAGGGAAIAATQFGSPKEESQAVVNDAAKQLGVTPSELSAALKKALENRVDAAVAAGRLTKEQGAELKKRIEAGDVPLFGGPGFAGPGHLRGFGHLGPPGDLDAAADYLGLTEAQLEKQLNTGKTLAQVAKSRDKSVDGLISALYDSAKKKLDAGVAAGRLTKAQEESILADLKSRLSEFVNNAQLRIDRDGPRGGLGPRGFRFHGPPPSAAFGDPAI